MIVRRICLAGMAALFALPVASGAQNQEPSVQYPSAKQAPPGAKDLLQAVLGNLTPRQLQHDWNRPADLMPIPSRGFAGRRLSLSVGGTPAQVFRDMRLYAGSPRSRMVAEFPFRVNIPGVNKLTFDCELVEAVLPSGLILNLTERQPPRTIGVVRQTFGIPGPGNGQLRIGFTLFEGAQEASSGSVPIAACTMEASGTTDGRNWRTSLPVAHDFAVQSAPQQVYVVDPADGTLVLPRASVTGPVVRAYAMPPGSFPGE